MSYRSGTKHFTTNELSCAVAQACIEAFYLGGFRFAGMPRIIAERVPFNREIPERVHEKKDFIDVLLVLEDYSEIIRFNFKQAAHHVNRFRRKQPPDKDLFDLAEQAIISLEWVLNN